MRIPTIFSPGFAFAAIESWKLIGEFTEGLFSIVNQTLK